MLLIITPGFRQGLQIFRRYATLWIIKLDFQYFIFDTNLPHCPNQKMANYLINLRGLISLLQKRLFYFCAKLKRLIPEGLVPAK